MIEAMTLNRRRARWRCVFVALLASGCSTEPTSTADTSADARASDAEPAEVYGDVAAGADDAALADSTAIDVDVPDSASDSSPTDAVVDGASLLPGSGNYQRTCGGSGGVWVDATHFLDFDDETQVAFVYSQGVSGAPVQQQDISVAIGLTTSSEADLEDAARVGNRVYVVTSHARDKSGTLEASRYKLFALDLAGTVPTLSMKVAGVYSSLLPDMLNAANWVTPNAAILTALDNASQLSKPTVTSLAPKDAGTNVEGLAALGDTGKLVIGFRNPRSGGDAILVTLLNADAVIGGAKARFGEAITMNLAGNGIRGMAWSAAHNAVLLISGPHDGGSGPFALWKWSGAAVDAPTKVQALTAPAGAAPEAVVPYPGTKDVQVLFDMGTFQIEGNDCKNASTSKQYFSDVIVHVP
jgi:hypothetical protein